MINLGHLKATDRSLSCVLMLSPELLQRVIRTPGKSCLVSNDPLTGAALTHNSLVLCFRIANTDYQTTREESCFCQAQLHYHACTHTHTQAQRSLEAMGYRLRGAGWLMAVVK